MNSLCLKKKIMCLVLFISLFVPITAIFIVQKNQATTESYNSIAEKNLPKTRAMGELLFNFRQVRIQFRSLGLLENSSKDIDTYFTLGDDAIKEFKKSKDKVREMMIDSPEETQMVKVMNETWENFYQFGGELMALVKKGDPESLKIMADKIRYDCPVISKKFEDAVQAMILWQKNEAEKSIVIAKTNAQNTLWFSILLGTAGIVLSLGLGAFFANSLVKKLIKNMSDLSQSAEEIFNRSHDVADISTRLSTSASQQASSLQETVASIDEISAMISRNSDSAMTSANSSEASTRAASKGRENAELMSVSIQEISHGNSELVEQMNNSNKEISEIVNVIQEIAEKTQVINDIVFQTKLLSFNASVEAARAGEHGKGFAVVAEEVGNLASMSGNAATEITDMLSKSVAKVSEIVERSKTSTDNLMKRTKDRIEIGGTKARECAASLDEILSNVSSVNEMVREISIASQEQTSGVKEINKAMSQLDQVTQQNSNSSQSSSKLAQDLNFQVNRLNSIVGELSFIVEGRIPKISKQPDQKKNNIAPIKKIDKVVQIKKWEEKKAVSLNLEAPSSNDSRFEEV